MGNRFRAKYFSEKLNKHKEAAVMRDKITYYSGYIFYFPKNFYLALLNFNT